MPGPKRVAAGLPMLVDRNTSDVVERVVSGRYKSRRGRDRELVVSITPVETEEGRHLAIRNGPSPSRDRGLSSSPSQSSEDIANRLDERGRVAGNEETAAK